MSGRPRASATLIAPFQQGLGSPWGAGRFRVQAETLPVSEPVIAHGRVYVTTAEAGSAFGLAR
jgi:hypothetical protein